MSRPHGFTLIELVVVILILGILAATALPKFVDLGRDARIAKVKAIDGAIRSAAEQWHVALMITDPACVSKNEDLTRNGVTVFTRFCYPQAGGLGPQTVGDFGHNEIEKMVDYSGFTVYRPDIYTTTFRADGASNPATCAAEYIESLSPNAPPTYSIVTDGC